MTNTSKKQNRKNSLKNVKAQLKRRNDKIARLEATIAQLKESQKKLQSKLWTKISRLLQKHSKTPILRVCCQICRLAQMRNKLQHSRYCYGY